MKHIGPGSVSRIRPGCGRCVKLIFMYRMRVIELMYGLTGFIGTLIFLNLTDLQSILVLCGNGRRLFPAQAASAVHSINKYFSKVLRRFSLNNRRNRPHGTNRTTGRYRPHRRYRTYWSVEWYRSGRIQGQMKNVSNQSVHIRPFLWNYYRRYHLTAHSSRQPCMCTLDIDRMESGNAKVKICYYF